MVDFHGILIDFFGVFANLTNTVFLVLVYKLFLPDGSWQTKYSYKDRV